MEISYTSGCDSDCESEPPLETKPHEPQPRLRVRFATRNQTGMNRDHLLRLASNRYDSRPPLRLATPLRVETTRYTNTVGPSLSRAQSVEPNDLSCELFVNGLVCVCYLGRLRSLDCFVIGLLMSLGRV
ncbi:hypothetical protein Hanom_Chr15g01405731 [Helianthus anomalus]